MTVSNGKQVHYGCVFAHLMASFQDLQDKEKLLEQKHRALASQGMTFRTMSKHFQFALANF